MTYYNKYEDVPEHYRKHLDTFDLTDKQKVECLNSLWGIIESIYDRALGLGIYTNTDHQAWLAEQTAKHEAEDKKTPEELYQEGFQDWMARHGEKDIKLHGQEYAEKKAHHYAKIHVDRVLMIREQWQKTKASLDAKKAAEKLKPKKRERIPAS